MVCTPSAGVAGLPTESYLLWLHGGRFAGQPEPVYEMGNPQPVALLPGSTSVYAPLPLGMIHE
jgi:hypothetical protein